MRDITEINTQILSAEEIRKYLKKNTKGNGNGFAVVTSPLKVWKQTMNEDGVVIVALEIPIVALEIPIVALEIPIVALEIYSQILDKKEPYPQHKIRASAAKVIKQFDIGYVMMKDVFRGNGKYGIENYSEVKESQAYHDVDFIYKTGREVRPVGGFSRNFEVCASGIHFFVNLSYALEY